MSNYVPHYTKKKMILERKEANLRRLVEAKAPVGKLTEAAEHVRQSRVRVVRAERATIVPTGDRTLYDRIDARIQTLADTPVELILDEFGVALGN
ncbi:MAG: hypothetical protein ACI8P0_002577 [Planctomycetaceae bacterium]|jgi:hypothetical protein